MPLVGIVDLGSNSVRLVVYNVKCHVRSKRPRDGEMALESGRSYGGKRIFREVMDKKRVAGLSAYVADGPLSKDGIEKAIDVVSDLIRAAQNIGCDKVHVFATAVIRNCSNSLEAAEQISNATGAELDILSAYDEAHLGFVGATCNMAIADGTLIDIGGGSTELTAIRDGRDTHDLSIPQGCVSSYAQFVDMILPKPDEQQGIRDAFEKKLDAIEGIDDFAADRLYGIGGGARAVDKLYAAAFSADNRLHTLEAYQIDALLALLREQPSKFAHAATKAVPERLHTVTPGIIIARTLMERLGADTLTICKYGVREGYLLERVLDA